MSHASLKSRVQKLEQSNDSGEVDYAAELIKAQQRFERGETVEPTDWQAAIDEYESALNSKLPVEDRKRVESSLAALNEC